MYSRPSLVSFSRLGFIPYSLVLHPATFPLPSLVFFFLSTRGGGGSARFPCTVNGTMRGPTRANLDPVFNNPSCTIPRVFRTPNQDCIFTPPPTFCFFSELLGVFPPMNTPQLPLTPSQNLPCSGFCLPAPAAPITRRASPLRPATPDLRLGATAPLRRRTKLPRAATMMVVHIRAGGHAHRGLSLSPAA